MDNALSREEAFVVVSARLKSAKTLAFDGDTLFADGEAVGLVQSMNIDLTTDIPTLSFGLEGLTRPVKVTRSASKVMLQAMLT